MIQPTAYPVPPAFRLPAVARLLGLAPTADLASARRFIADAPSQGVNLDLLWAWGVPPESRAPVSPARAAAHFDQVTLIVPGAGRVGMVFGSPPRSRSRPDPGEHAGLVAAINAACHGVGERHPEQFALIQSLVEAPQAWLRRALVGAGFLSVGRLLYLRRLNDPPPGPRLSIDGPWAGGVRVVTARALGSITTQNRVLESCLERTYEGTLDCPELFGLRETADILASHRACGRHDPDLWWVAMRGDRAVGCALFNPYPEQGSIELVYLGLSPDARGQGLGAGLLTLGLQSLARMNMQRVACAVDERNAPARRLYDRLGFSRFDTREAFVRRP